MSRIFKYCACRILTIRLFENLSVETIQILRVEYSEFKNLKISVSRIFKYCACRTLTIQKFENNSVETLQDAEEVYGR